MFGISLQVILTNDLTTAVTENGTDVFPALGESFGHRVQYRLLLSKIPNQPNEYTALLKKSVEHGRSAARFTVNILLSIYYNLYVSYSRNKMSAEIGEFECTSCLSLFDMHAALVH